MWWIRAILVCFSLSISFCATQEPDNDVPSLQQVLSCAAQTSDYSSVSFCQCVLQGTAKEPMCTSSQFGEISSALDCAATNLANATKACLCFVDKLPGLEPAMCSAGMDSTVGTLLDCVLTQDTPQDICRCYVDQENPDVAALCPSDTGNHTVDTNDTNGISHAYQCLSRFPDVKSSKYCMCQADKHDTFFCEYSSHCSCDVEGVNCSAKCGVPNHIGIGVILVILVCCGAIGCCAVHALGMAGGAAYHYRHRLFPAGADGAQGDPLVYSSLVEMGPESDSL